MPRSHLALLALVLTGPEACLTRAELAERTVRIVGSDTELSAVQRLAEAYRERHPEVVVSVAGGGSGAGIAALLDGRTDIANSSREVRSKERELAERRGLELESIVLGVDALAVIVNHRNELERIGLDELGRIYRGEVNRWSELGGADRPITRYGRQSNSGTYLFFRANVVRDDYARDMRNLNGNAQIVESVRVDPGGIGYVGVGYVATSSEGVTILELETPDGRRVHPANTAAVEREDYPVSRPLYQYFAVPIRRRVADFLEFELSDRGQAFIEAEGFHRAGRASRRDDEQRVRRAVRRAGS